MKRYIRIALFTLVAQCGLSNVIYAMNIAPTTTGDDSIVNAIKQHSNLTEADVNQWKLLWLGRLGTYGSFIAGAASVVAAGTGTYQKAVTVQSMTPQAVPYWITNPVVLAGLGSLGAGYVSYKTLYPRIRNGVINKVQKFIDVCNALYWNSPEDSNGTRFSIVTYDFSREHNSLGMLKAYLPKSWSSRNDVAVYNALNNLAKQGERAQVLLNQIGADDEVNDMKEVVKIYSNNLASNAKLYAFAIGDKQRKKREEAELAGIEAGTSLMKAKTIETYAGMATGAARNIWKGVTFLYENKEYIMGAAASVGLMGAYSYVKAKLGYGQ